MITLTLTSYHGNLWKMPFATEIELREFLSALPSRLNKNTPLRAECDLLVINKIIRGEK